MGLFGFGKKKAHLPVLASVVAPLRKQTFPM